MNKRLIIFVILIAALALSAVNPWPSILVIRNWSGSNVYIRLTYRGEQKYFLTATPEGNSDVYYESRFDVVRRRYTAELTACDTTTKWARLDMDHNMRLSFTACESMKQYWTPKYWGEPSMEKPNMWTPGSTFGQHVPENDPWNGWLYDNIRFHFIYDLVPGRCWNDSKDYVPVPDLCP